MSHYKDYIKELKKYEMLEDDNGFATYGFMHDGGKKYCYIEDIYVVPEKRKTKVASQFADQVAVLAKQEGCSGLLGSVVPSLPGSHYRMQVLLGYGFKLHSSQYDLVYFVKEFSNG